MQALLKEQDCYMYCVNSLEVLSRDNYYQQRCVNLVQVLSETVSFQIKSLGKAWIHMTTK